MPNHDPRDVEFFGQDLLDVVDRTAAAKTAGLQRHVAALSDQLAEEKRQRLIRDMNQLVPNWEQLNADPNFIAWIQLPDEFAPATRQQLVQAAWDAGDANRVAAFFNGYSRGGDGRPRPVAQGQGQGQPAGGQQRQLGTVVTGESIDRFYREVAAGLWRGREAEQAAREVEIFAAQREGRVVSTGAARNSFSQK